MKKHFKQIIIYTLVLMFVLSASVPRNSSFADELPAADDYVQLKVRINGNKTDEVAYTIKGNIYIKLSTLSKYGDTSKFTADEENGRLLFNTTELTMDFGNPQLTEYIQQNAGEVYVPIKTFDDENGKNDKYVSIGPIAQIAKLIWNYSDETLYITQYANAENLATAGVVNNTASSLSNKNNVGLYTGEKVFITGESNAFYKVSDASGDSYYVNKDDVKKIDDNTLLNDFEYYPTAKDSFEGTINLAFLNIADTAQRTGLPPDTNGAVDVLAPPWMHQIVNGNGEVSHIIDYGFVQLAHQMGAKVWIVANNLFTTTGSTKYTTKVMESEKLSDKVIAKYLFYACLNGADGICLDYEDLLKSDREAYTDFNLKLAKYCDMLGLTYSVCTSIPTSYNSMYNWGELGKHVDYIIPMTYVEHMANKGSEATEDVMKSDIDFDHGNMGSVSSYKWYSYWMNKLKELVPAKKILMGVPFFSRYYYTDENNIISESGTITMSSMRKRIKEVGDAQISWNEKDQQFVVRYHDEDGTLVNVWLEDPHSLAVRMNYVLESGIGGTACWAIEQIDSETLQLFKAVFKDGVDASTYYYPTYFNE